jgi:hypothetical protein
MCVPALARVFFTSDSLRKASALAVKLRGVSANVPVELSTGTSLFYKALPSLTTANK